MPELPEVETVARGLQLKLPGRRIVQVRFGKTDFIENPARIEEALPGLRVREVRRHGKFLVLELEAPDGNADGRKGPAAKALVIHLGMTGKLITCPPEAPPVPHTHAFFSLDDGHELRYADARRFGQIRLAEEEGFGFLTELGIDPLEASEAEFAAALQSRGARVKALLMDQRVFRGMGNIYTDESLWRARIHPKRLGENLKRQEVRRLYKTVQRILKQAIEMRGSSISDYVDASGQRGEFQKWHRAYGREGKRCYRCKGTIRRIIVAGRSTFLCPHCQKAPRES
jgi:formamidopyrimidine-DNA glycosylase